MQAEEAKTEEQEVAKGTVAAAPEPEESPIPQPTDDELPAVVEALLFAATTPLNVNRLSTLTGGMPKDLIEAALADLRDAYAGRRTGLAIMEVAGGYQMATRPEVADWVLALHKHRKKNPLTPALMETLAIVAYKQPLVRAEIEAIRGVDCGGVMRALQDSGLVEVVGQKETPGRPSLYGTTELFLKTFGLRGLAELPSLSELNEILKAPMHRPEEEPEADEPETEEGTETATADEPPTEDPSR